MNTAFNIIKILGSWGCIVGSVVCLVLIKDMALAGTLGILSIAFSQAPTGG